MSDMWHKEPWCREPIGSVYCYGTIKRETDRAWLFVDVEGGEHWLAKSQCQWDAESGCMWIPAWLARKGDGALLYLDGVPF